MRFIPMAPAAGEIRVKHQGMSDLWKSPDGIMNGGAPEGRAKAPSSLAQDRVKTIGPAFSIFQSSPGFLFS